MLAVFFLTLTRFSGSACFCFVLNCLSNGKVIDMCRKKDATYRLNPTFQLNIQNHIVHGYIYKSFLFMGKRGFWSFYNLLQLRALNKYGIIFYELPFSCSFLASFFLFYFLFIPWGWDTPTLHLLFIVVVLKC